MSSENLCYICKAEEEGKNINLYCNCTGQFTHEDCLMKWIQTSHHEKCSVCLYTYNIKRDIPRINLAFNPKLKLILSYHNYILFFVKIMISCLILVFDYHQYSIYPKEMILNICYRVVEKDMFCLVIYGMPSSGIFRLLTRAFSLYKLGFDIMFNNLMMLSLFFHIVYQRFKSKKYIIPHIITRIMLIYYLCFETDLFCRIILYDSVTILLDSIIDLYKVLYKRSVKRIIPIDEK